MEVLAGIKVLNVPEYATSGDYPYWIVRVKEQGSTEAKFWSAYKTKEQALECIKGMNNAVLVYYTIQNEI
ncbi:MAG: hypothetical protein IJ675_05295 [Pseudobutyrivibrio sp.]|nr:hypothetical protein [Pseudobutyrivibrio sp.]